jgi:hypothetical protein
VRSLGEILEPASLYVSTGRSLSMKTCACASMAQKPNLFEIEPQRDLFGAELVPAYRPDPENVRSRLHKILAEAKAAKKLPWEPTTMSLYRTIFRK